MNRILVKNGSVLNEDGTVSSSCDIAITDTVIESVGEVKSDFIADSIIDATDCLVTPGLINAHTHAYMTALRGLADDLPFNEWLFNRISPAEDNLSEEDARLFSLSSMMEMIKSGTTCFTDMHMFCEQSLSAAREIGMRAVLTRGIVGESRTDEEALRRLSEALREAQHADEDKMVSVMLAPHAIYTCGKDLLMFLIETAREKKLRFNIHLSESEAEVRDCLAAHNLTPPAYLDSLGFFDISTLAAHCVHVTDRDIDLLKEKNVSVAACPVSNARLGNGFAPLLKMKEKGINICFGTDSAASNNSLDLLREMSAASLIHKGLSKDPTALPAPWLIGAATANAAQALGLADAVGTIAPGKKADIALFNLRNLSSIPHPDPISSLIYAVNSAQTKTVLINGSIVYHDGHFQSIDEEEILARTSQFQAVK